MDDAQKRVNEVYNEIRTILKMEDGQTKGKRSAELLTTFANMAAGVINSSKDPGFMAATHFGGFSTIAMMIGATDDTTSAEDKLKFILTILGMCTGAINKLEGTDGTEENEQES